MIKPAVQRLARFAVAISWIAIAPQAARSDVVIIANRSGSDVEIRRVATHGGSTTIVIPASQITTIPTRGHLDVELKSSPKVSTYRLDANSAYYVGEQEGNVSLHKIGLGGDATTRQGRAISSNQPLDKVGVIKVKVLVDDENPLVRAKWEKLLRSRVAHASRLLEPLFYVRLEVIAAERWDSDDDTLEFPSSLKEFSAEVDPDDANIAIGFSSQYSVPQGRVHLGGTPGPFARHILIRDYSRFVTEAERLEVLVHELGHVLGGAHSPEPTSVMRPILGDRKARRADFAITFDPVSALTIYLVTEEIRFRDVTSIGQLTPATKMRLYQIYGELDKALLGDFTALTFRTLLMPTRRKASP